MIEEELPEELKSKVAAFEKNRGEASLKGHLRNPGNAGKDKDKDKDAKVDAKDGKEIRETSGSSAYVPKEPEKDTQLQYALNILRGNLAAAQAFEKAPDNTAAPTGEKKAVPN